MEPGQEVIVGTSINNTMGITGRSYDLRQLLGAAGEAEAMGFDAVWVHDALGGRRTTAAYCPIGALTAIAGRTRRIRLATGILIPQIRNPVHVAQQWATLWEISEGRAIMGVGTGAGKAAITKRQFDAAACLRGPDGSAPDPARLFRRRTALFNESLDVINRLWTEDKFLYDGEFFRFGEITLGVARPAAKPPILVGGGIYVPRDGVGAHHYVWNERVAGTLMMGPRIRRVVADQGDGWLAVHPTPDEYAEIRDDIRAIAAAAGKAPGGGAAYGGAAIMGMNWFANCGPDPRAAWRGVQDQLTEFHGPPAGRDRAAPDLVNRWALSGTGREMAEKINRYIALGVRVFQLVIASPDQLGMMRRIADEMLPHVDRTPAVAGV